MRFEEMFFGWAACSWMVSFVGCHSPGAQVEQVTGPGSNPEERSPRDTYTMANINVTYEDEHGEIYTETSEVI